jgi:hypothetical protein
MKDALKLALEALEYIHEGANNQGPHTGISWRCVSNKAEPVITALRQALEQRPADEPVAWATMLGSYSHVSWGKDRPDYPIRYEVPLYTQPPKRKPLTDEEIESINVRFVGRRDLARLFARAIEAAHGIKENT